MAYITHSISGGLGNQMFQIAACYSIAKDLSLILRISLKNFKGCGQGYSSEKYVNSVYKNINFEDNDIPFTTEFNLPTWQFKPINQDLRELFKKKNTVKLNGAFQSQKYFEKREEEIRELFTPEGGWYKWLINKPIFFEYPELFNNSNDICFIGVRRGDYLKNPAIHNPCYMDYYKAAMLENPASIYYIASDDIKWCKDNFIGTQFRFFDLNIERDIEQLAIMTLFEKFIISNSTFYWWGTFLANKKNKIIVPNEWISNPYISNWDCKSIYRDDMIIINRKISSNSYFQA